MPPVVRRRPGWRALAVLGAVAVLLPLLWVWKLHIDANRILERRSDSDRLEYEFHSHPERPSLLGEGDPGDAWECYAEAAATLERIMKSGSYDSNDPSEPGLDSLRRGARCRAVSFRKHQPFPSGVPSELSSLRSLLEVSLILAGSLHRKGRDREALERIRVVLAVVRDLELHGRHPGDVADVEMDAHDMTFIILEKHALEAADLGEHAAFLDRLEELRPDLLPAIRFALDRGPDVRHPPGWRHLFSDMIQQAAWVQEADAAYAIAKSLIAPVEGRRQAIEGRIASGRAWTVEEIFMIDGARRMYARLARIGVELAAHEREHGRFPGSLREIAPAFLRCPYTGLPFVDRSSEGLVYSPGFDLDDDRGTAVQSAESHGLQLRYHLQGDVVVRVGRK